MTETLVFFRLLAASQVVFAIVALLLSSNPRRVSYSCATLGITVVAYLLEPLAAQYIYDGLAIPLGFLAGLEPLLVYIVAFYLFEDDRPLPWFAKIFGSVYVVSIMASAVVHWAPELIPPDSGAAIKFAAQVQKLLVIGAALYLARTGAVSDLIGPRIRLRNYFVVVIGVLATLIVTVELLLAWDVPESIEALGTGLIFAASLGTNVLLLRANPPFRIFPTVVQSPSEQESTLLKTIQSQIESERIYADHDLRIRQLAERFSLQEYRLRKMINQGLGYRNFNQFINRFRLNEAAQRLTSEPEVPILTIALDAGFRSISTFNTAFRELHDQSPSEYRKGRRGQAPFAVNSPPRASGPL